MPITTASYTTIVPPYVNTIIRLRERSYGADRMEPEEYRNFVEEYADELVEAVMDADRMTYPRLDSENLGSALLRVGRSIDPNYLPLSREDRETRKAASEDFRENYTRLCAVRALNEKQVPVPEAYDPRAIKNDMSLLYIGTDPETFQKNELLFARLHRTPADSAEARQERAEAIIGRLREMAGKDLGKLDLRSPRSISENLMEFGDVMEAGRVLPYYQAEITGREDYAFYADMNKLNEVSGILQQQTELFASPLYSEMRLESLPRLGTEVEFSALSTEDSILQDAQYGLSETQKGLISTSLQTLGSMQKTYRNSGLLDPDKTPAERSNGYQAAFYERSREEQRIAPSPDWQLRSEYRRTYLDEKNKLIERIPEFKERLRANVSAMQEKGIDIRMTEAEVDDMFTEEKLDAAAKMRAYGKQRMKVLSDQTPHNGNAVPGNMSRSLHAFLDVMAPDDDARRTERDALLDLLNDEAPESADRRRQLFLDKLNAVVDASPDDVDLTRPMHENVRWFIDNAATLEFGHEFHNIRSGLNRRFGLVEGDKANLDLIEVKGQDLGGTGLAVREFVSADEFFTIPLHLMNEAQLREAPELLLEQGSAPGPAGIDVRGFGLLTTISQFQKDQADRQAAAKDPQKTAENTPHRVTAADLRYSTDPEPEKNVRAKANAAPGAEAAPEAPYESAALPELRLAQTLEKLQKDLEAQDRFFRRNNSPEFNALKEKLTEVNAHLQSAINKEEADRQPIDRELLSELDTAAIAYSRHVNALEDRASRKQTRRKAISESIKQAVSDFDFGKDKTASQARVNAGVASAIHEENLSDAGLQTYEKAIARTDRLTAEQAGLKKGSAEELLYGHLIESRNELANQVRQNPDRAAVHREVSKILGVQLLLNKKDALQAMGEKLTPEAFSAQIGRMVEQMADVVSKSPALAERTQTMTGNEIGEFLAGPGEHSMLTLYTDSYRSEQARGRESGEAIRDNVRENERENARADEREATQDLPEKGGPER